MSEMRCLHCYATTTNGLALCDLCQRRVRLDLEFLPIYFRNLARWRPGRAGSREVPGSRVLWQGEQRIDSAGDRIMQALDDAGTILVSWADCLADDRPEIRPALELGEVTEVQQAARLCEIFTDALITVATLEWCGEFVREIGEQGESLRSLTESSIPGWYAGLCRRQVTMDERCGEPTYVVPGLTWVTCGRCGATTYARDHIDVVLSEAEDWVATPKRLAEAIVALRDDQLSVPRLVDDIRHWSHRDKLVAHRRLDSDGDPVGPNRYRFGDVLDLIEAKRRAPRVACA